MDDREGPGSHPEGYEGDSNSVFDTRSRRFLHHYHGGP